LIASLPINAFSPFQILQGVPECSIADQISFDPAQRIEIDATFNPALASEFDKALRSQFQSVKVVPVENPSTEVCTAPTTGKEHIICE
jgi:hypothetical protein